MPSSARATEAHANAAIATAQDKRDRLMWKRIVTGLVSHEL
ncbi:hypothetical protein ABI_37920 [Asticcacaulis biprosthecium C19]|uniref:Uncharacterized protein n=1 Tax=Asticcacaulis biprosthecium C19 TaxID=715226 RepID=F4QRC3_9CAUL|nr:hypothetical protein [Asticcacaulis biprosthecium]EGF90760.1 hypothetical protein ABI_37920 [Asticcacaulis biprosthecium C19]